jgi:hypothetical protein
MGRRHRERRPARRAPHRDPKPLVLVVCEGAVTEPEYLQGFRTACSNPRVSIEVYPGKGVPKTIVEVAKEHKKRAELRAQRERDENLRYDSVWCVFDFDDHPAIPDATQMARDNAIDLAVSNPCIELWLLLHFQDQPGMQHRDKVDALLKRHVPDYDKHIDFAAYERGYCDAVKRARRLDADAERDNEPGRNPTTGVWRLTESIRADSAGFS